MPDPTLDLVVLVPGKDEQETLAGLLSSRRASLGIAEIRYQILDPHPRRDPGCYREAPEVLQPYVRRARHALVVFDHEGSGQELRPARELAADVEDRLRASGWEDRSQVLVLEPELESWVWSPSPEVDTVLGWRGRTPALRQWLRDQGRWEEGRAKPERPKECMVAALREVRVQRSSALFRQLAEQVGLSRCQDPGFSELRRVLTAWFPASK